MGLLFCPVEPYNLVEIKMISHPAANAFPLMSPERYEELKTDIATQGQLEPVTICDSQILDGRNRYRACVELGITPKTRVFDGNPWAYVWSLNGQRRDLSQDQRAQIWIFVNTHSAGWEEEKQKIVDKANRGRSEAAKAQPRTDAGEFQPVTVQSGPPPVNDRHPSRKASASAASVQPSAIARAEALQAARPDLAEKVRAGTVKPAEARRQAVKDAVSDKVSALPRGLFTVVYADPPWKYNDKQGGDISESYGAAEKHYPAMSLSELKALDIPSAPDAVLFLWATSPLLPDALDLAQAWGFRYKASFVWDKVKHNMGHYNSVRHEFLLVCTKGSCTPQNVKLFDSVQTIERTGHSEKPEIFREIIETLYPHGNRLEMFGRKTAKGWRVWGSEVQ